MPPLKKRQYHIQAYENSGKNKKTDDYPDDNNEMKLEFKEQKPELEIMKIEKNEDQNTAQNEMMYSDMHVLMKHKNETKEETGINFTRQDKDNGSQFLYQPLTPPSPKSSTTTAYASKLLQQLQIHRQNSSTNSKDGNEFIHNGNNPLNQLAEISLAAAAVHATTTPNNTFDEDMKNSFTKQNIIANLMFPTILHHFQLQQRSSEEEMNSSNSFVPTPSTTPSPPPAHGSPSKYQAYDSDGRSQHSALMEILNKPPLKPNPPIAHDTLSLPRVATSRSHVQNDNPYGSINRLQIPRSNPRFELPPPQTAPEDLSVNKIARKLNFRETSYGGDRKDIFAKQDSLIPQPQKLLLSNVYKTSLPQISSNRDSVESRSSESSTVGQHECQDCGKVYSTSSNLARHRQTHR